jgi:hypothetical protein
LLLRVATLLGSAPLLLWRLTRSGTGLRGGSSASASASSGSVTLLCAIALRRG